MLFLWLFAAEEACSCCTYLRTYVQNIQLPAVGYNTGPSIAHSTAHPWTFALLLLFFNPKVLSSSACKYARTCNSCYCQLQVNSTSTHLGFCLLSALVSALGGFGCAFLWGHSLNWTKGQLLIEQLASERASRAIYRINFLHVDCAQVVKRRAVTTCTDRALAME